MVRDSLALTYADGTEEPAAAELPPTPRLAPATADATPRWSITGNEAAGLGAVRGGVRYVAAYPITPATSASHYLAAAFHNAGGFVRLGPLTLGHAIGEMGGECVVHIACRDRSRAALQSTVFGLASEGLTNALALSGDYPKEGFHGRSRAVFDIDSVGLISMLRDAGNHGPSFTIGCAINPFKAVEADLIESK